LHVDAKRALEKEEEEEEDSYWEVGGDCSGVYILFIGIKYAVRLCNARLR